MTRSPSLSQLLVFHKLITFETNMNYFFSDKTTVLVTILNYITDE